MPADFSPYDFLARTLRYWMLVILIMIVGGLAGYLLHLTLPPLYESQASISFAFNVNRFGLRTASEEDQAMGTAVGIMASTSVFQFTADQARQHGYILETAPLNRSVFIERKSYLWVVRVRDPDPQAAAFIANTWVQRAYQELLDASSHAARAEALFNYLKSLETCLQRISAAGPAFAQCSLGGLADLQKELQTTGAQYDIELTLGRGFLPYLIFDPPAAAAVPLGALQYSRNTMVLAGVLIGFLLAIAIVAADLPLTLAKRIRNAPTGAEPRR
jgi:uncharacterized protein YdbL (DUF1318 family)